MNYFHVGRDDEGFFLSPCNVTYVGVFFQMEGRVNMSDFSQVQGNCVGIPKICGLKEGKTYSIMYGDPILIEKAEYVGVGPVDLPTSRAYREEERVNFCGVPFHLPPFSNEFLIFQKGYLKIYVHREAGVEVKPC